MTIAIRNWVQSHRYQVTIRQLRALSTQELRALGIAPTQIEHLALEEAGGERSPLVRTSPYIVESR